MTLKVRDLKKMLAGLPDTARVECSVHIEDSDLVGDGDIDLTETDEGRVNLNVHCERLYRQQPRTFAQEIGFDDCPSERRELTEEELEKIIESL